MTVFYILDSFPVLSENFILREILSLKKLGVNIRIFAFNKPAEEAVNPAALPLMENVEYLEKCPFSKKLSTVAVNLFRHPVLFAKLSFSLIYDMSFSFRFMCQRLNGAIHALAIADLADAKPDHVHAHFAYVTADTARILAGFAGCKWSVSAHAWDIFTQSPEIVARRIEGADKVFVCSVHGKNLLENMIPGQTQHDRIVLMYHGVETREFEAGEQADHIIAVGRLEEKKGFEVLLRACKILAEQNIRPRFIIIGEGPQREKLDAEIRNSGLKNVELLGSLSFDKVKMLMAESIMLVHPGRTAGNGDHDGIPNVLLEAMALGKPVIATSVGGISELIENRANGLLVEADDSEQLSESVRALLTDKVLAETIGKAAKEHVKRHFEISETVQPLFKYFVSQINRSP